MKKLLSLVTAIMIAATTFAQEATVTTIGTGRTEEEATLRALRNALEQTFGTFVSANTSIVNDALVRDEIVATSKGNVKEYKKMAIVQLPNQTISVTLKATVSINKLISYARNNGSKAEFAGQTYAMNVKMLEFQRENAKKTLNLMKTNVIALCHGVFDYEIELGEIRKESFYHGDKAFVTDYILPFSLNIFSTNVTTNIYSLITETLDALRMDPTTIKDFDRNKLVHYGDMPVSGEFLDDIWKSIRNAIINDFLKVKLRKIGNAESYYFKYFASFPKNIDAYQYVNYSVERPNGYAWLISDKLPKLILPLHMYAPPIGWPSNCINITWSHPNLSHILFPCAGGLYSFSELTKWNTNINGHIFQQELHSFPLGILLTEQELERFKGLELVGVTSPKYTSAPKPDSKKENTKGNKKR